MLKRKALNRILLTSVLFLVVFTLYNLVYIDFDNGEVIDSNKDKSYIYTLNNDDYISKASVYVSKVLSLEEKLQEKLEIMIKDNNKNALLPSYFNPVLPSGTKIEDVVVENQLVKLYFSKELLDISEEQSEKMIEAIIYTIMDQDILGIEIYVDGNILKYVPHTDKKLPTILDDSFGINKSYDFVSSQDIVKVSMVYFGLYDGEYFEVPVTKYVNDKREKLEIVFDELSDVLFDSSLVSLIENVEILDYKILDDRVVVNFNRELSRDEEYVFCGSIFANYDVEKVEILVKNEKKLEKYKKDIVN